MFPIPLSRFATPEADRIDEREHVCLVLTIRPGRSDDARAFLHELEHVRKDEYAESERRIGVTKEVWHLARIEGGDALIASIETPDVAVALERLSASCDTFDLWFKRRLSEATGIDLNDPRAISRAETLFVYPGR